MPSSWGPSRPMDQIQVFHIPGGFFTIWATREAHINKVFFSWDFVLFFPWNICLYFLIIFGSLYLFHVLNKTATSLSLEGVALLGDNSSPSTFS